MFFATSSLQTLAVLLLAKDVVAAVHGRHAHYHHRKRDMLTVTDDVWITLTEDIIQTITDTCYVTVEWSDPAGQPTSVPAAVTTQVVSVLPVQATTTPAAMPSSTAAAAAQTGPVQAAVQKPSTSTSTSTSTVAASTSSPAAVVVPTTMATVVKPTTTTAAATSAKASSAASGAVVPVSGSKRGIAYNDASLTDPFTSGKVAWAYNWDSTPSGNIRAGLEFVPMLWGMNNDVTSVWSKNAAAAIAAGSTHLLGFNEPDLNSQSNLDVGTAVAGWKQYMEPFAGKATLISPAVTNGNSPMGITWLTNFLQQCTGCSVGCVAVHWYAGADSLQYFKDHVTEAHTATGKCVWVTEFQAITGSASDIATFLTAAMAWLDQQPFVERYAYFMASQGNLVAGSGLSALGSVFNS